MIHANFLLSAQICMTPIVIRAPVMMRRNPGVCLLCIFECVCMHTYTTRRRRAIYLYAQKHTRVTQMYRALCVREWNRQRSLVLWHNNVSSVKCRTQTTIRRGINGRGRNSFVLQLGLLPQKCRRMKHDRARRRRESTAAGLNLASFCGS